MVAVSGPIVTAMTATVYRVGGRGKAWFSRDAAYRSAAIHRVIRACEERHDRLCKVPDGMDVFEFMCSGATCRYCSRRCAGLRKQRHISHYSYHDDREPCERDATHSYRYRLIGRLARWLKWRDGVLAREGR